MARVSDKGLSGAVGNLVFYVVNGVGYARSKSGKRRKKRGQKTNPLNRIFGLVSSYGSSITNMLKKQFPFPFNRSTNNEIRGWMLMQYKTYGLLPVWDLQAKTNSICQLNSETDWRNYLAVTISVTNNGNGEVKIQLPSFIPTRDLQAPPRTRQVNLKMMLLTSPFREKGTQNSFCMEQYRFSYDENAIAAQEFRLNSPAASGDIALVAMALEFETANSGQGIYLSDQQWLPAAILAMGRL